MLQQFPKDWMEILNSPDKFYRITAQVGKVAHKYREPLYAAVTIRNLPGVAIHLGNGNGTFQSSQMDVGIGMAEIAVGDFNRDGNKDLYGVGR